MSRATRDVAGDARLLEAAVVVALSCLLAAAIVAAGFLVHWAAPHWLMRR